MDKPSGAKTKAQIAAIKAEMASKSNYRERLDKGKLSKKDQTGIYTRLMKLPGAKDTSNQK